MVETFERFLKALATESWSLGQALLEGRLSGQTLFHALRAYQWTGLGFLLLGVGLHILGKLCRWVFWLLVTLAAIGYLLTVGTAIGP